MKKFRGFAATALVGAAIIACSGASTTTTTLLEDDSGSVAEASPSSDATPTSDSGPKDASVSDAEAGSTCVGGPPAADTKRYMFGQLGTGGRAYVREQQRASCLDQLGELLVPRDDRGCAPAMRDVLGQLLGFSPLENQRRHDAHALQGIHSDVDGCDDRDRSVADQDLRRRSQADDKRRRTKERFMGRVIIKCGILGLFLIGCWKSVV